MSLNLEQKQALVAEVSAEVAKAQAIVLAEYRSLTVGHMTDLRKKARTSGVYLRVLKNTLARRAVADSEEACGDVAVEKQAAIEVLAQKRAQPDERLQPERAIAPRRRRLEGIKRNAIHVAEREQLAKETGL